MILSAMMFALGVFVSGLVWLALAAALVRRARRLTERRILASVATRRAEFQAERDELRARHAVEMHRQEREASRVLDMATAHRLEADVKERELVSLKAEFLAREEDFADLQQRLAVERSLLQDLERSNAEAGTALRAAQHTLELEIRRRTVAEETLNEIEAAADQRRLEISALRAENEALRAIAPERAGPPVAPDAAAPPKLPLPSRMPTPPALPQGASIVSLPARPRPAGEDRSSATLVAEAARDLQRLVGEAHGDFAQGVRRAPARAERGAGPRAVEPSLVAAPDPPRNGAQPAKPAEAKESPEKRFFKALAEIRALKRSATPAGE
jgi:hypothetical protein